MSRVVTLVAGEPHDLSLEIERHLCIRSGDPLVLIEGDDFVLVKKASSADRAERFDELASRTRSRFQELGLSPKDVEDAITWARGSPKEFLEQQSEGSGPEE